jgi:hypothetical protein
MQANPFARAHQMMAAIAAAMSLGGSAQRDALADIGQYRSRGKGRGTASKKFGNPRGKYTPHIGAKEQERALRCYMQATFCTWETFHVPQHLRSAPIMCQTSPSEYPLPRYVA